ncbi:LLM class flavin-dependent oxidoreductase [Actinocorallia longicatena]|uniref:Luciferase-like domain-containing protein n=1 Tax=Actinocorallia longicatena TaxID=111803 RepID=A0ABP6Q3R0_9ACTN
MRIGYAPWGETLGELVDAAVRAERAGADTLWVSELHRSATVTAAAVAARTERARIGTAVALAFARSPLVTALEALDLDELSGGRLVLGLGSGVRRLIEDWHGQPFEGPVGRMRDTVEIIRLVVASAHTGEPLLHEGARRSLRMRGYRRPEPVRTRIPVHLAAVGPAMTALAGEIADGWISHELGSPRYLAERIAPGLAAAGRTPEIVVSACCSIDPDPAAARRAAAGTVGFYASVRTYADFFAFHGFAGEHAAVGAAFRAGLPPDVPEEMAAALTLSGDPEEVAEGVRAYAGTASSIKLAPPVHGLEPERTRRAQDRIIDLIGAL